MLVQSQINDDDPRIHSSGPPPGEPAISAISCRNGCRHRVMETLRNIGQVARGPGLCRLRGGRLCAGFVSLPPNEDIDIVVEGDGIAFAKAYAEAVRNTHPYPQGVRHRCHHFPDGFKIDVATARLEYYRSPAALPDVEMSSIKLDLFQPRLYHQHPGHPIGPDKFGQLLDFFSAQKDIKDKAIRVLHNLSFVEDPTRVFRALRFEQRFDFTIGKLTANLIQNAVKMDFFQRLSGRRVFAEIRLILEEDNPTPAIVRMQDFDLSQGDSSHHRNEQGADRPAQCGKKRHCLA
jgi:tRNA nucleotidyltransferase (CCA-adding enzyme)